MKTKIIEATNVDVGGLNWGKFIVMQFETTEWTHLSQISGKPLLRECGWAGCQPLVWVMDIQTGEGALFMRGGMASADLHKHQVWVCPMFEPFLEWLYKQDFKDVAELPALVKIEDPSSALAGYRRRGPSSKE